MDQASFVEHNNIGLGFMWTNMGQGTMMRASRLDRALVNSSWIATFGDSLLTVGLPGNFDHSPLLLQPFHVVEALPRPFKFLICGFHIQNFNTLLARFGVRKYKVIQCIVW